MEAQLPDVRRCTCVSELERGGGCGVAAGAEGDGKAGAAGPPHLDEATARADEGLLGYAGRMNSDESEGDPEERTGGLEGRGPALRLQPATAVGKEGRAGEPGRGKFTETRKGIIF